jgi:WD40 repeat protein
VAHPTDATEQRELADGPTAEAATGQDDAPDVFISYSRSDQQVVLRLAAALEAANWRVWVDVEDIPPTADWGEELGVGIQTAHTFVFAISPRSVRSQYCLRELDQALELGKRLVPIVLEESDDVPEPLAARQYVYLRDEDDFDASVQALTTALATDLDWVREHRQWLTAALRWEASGRDRSLLLRGRDLKSAEAWLARQAERTEPRPTRLQTEFLIASRSWQTRRLQVTVASVVLALAVSILLGILALLQRDTARREAAIARSRELATASSSRLSLDPELSLLLAVDAVAARPTAEADNALRSAVAAERPLAEVDVPGETVRSLVSDVAFAPTGRTVAMALADGTVRLARLRRRGARAVLLPLPKSSPSNLCSSFVQAQGHTRIAFSEDGRWLAAAGDKSWITLWPLSEPLRVVTSPFCLGRTTPPAPIDVAAATLGSGFGTVALAFADARTLAVMEESGRLIRWRWAAPAAARSERVGTAPVVAAAFAGHGGRTVALADGGGGLGEWISGRRVSLPGRIAGVGAVAVSADGSRFAAMHGNGITVWRSSGRPTTLAGTDSFRSVAISRDGETVAAGDEAGAVGVWRLSHPAEPVVLTGASGPVTAVAFSADGRRVLAGGDDGVIRVWEPNPQRGLGAGSTHVALTRDGTLVAAQPQGGPGAWANVDRPRRLLEDVADPAHLSFDGDGQRAVAAADRGAIELWDLPTSSHARVLAVDRQVVDATLSPDGRWLASAETGRLRLLRWPGRDALVLARSQPAANKFVTFTATVFSADGRGLAAAGYNGKTSAIGVWDVAELDAGAATKPRRRLLVDVPGAVLTLEFSPDGAKLLAAMLDGSLRVVNLGDGGVVVLRGHRGTVEDAAFSPSGDEIVSGGADGTVRVWELAESGKSVTLPGRVGIVTDVRFAGNGSRIEVVGTEGAAAWSCEFCGPIAAVLARARALTTRSLTPDERALYLHRL